MSVDGYSVSFVSSAGRIDATLWEACFPPPIEGRWWYETLEQSGLERQFSFLYGVIHRAGVSVGIAPAFVMDFPVSLIAPPDLLPLLRWLDRLAPSLSRPRTLFIGSPCADQGTVGLRVGVERRGALLAVQLAFRAKARELGAPLLVWKDFAQPDTADLDWLAQAEGLFRVVSFPGTIVELPVADKESYFAGLKASRRHNVRKKIRRSKEAVELRAEVLHAPDPHALDEIFGLFRQTCERAAVRFEELDRRFFECVARQPCAHFIVLREATRGEAVAFMLCFHLGDKVINKYLGFDYRRPAEWLLYFRLWDAALDWALSLDARSIQSGQTGYRPKIETGHRLVPLFNYCAHRSRLVHALAAAAARRIDWSTIDDDLAGQRMGA